LSSTNEAQNLTRVGFSYSRYVAVQEQQQVFSDLALSIGNTFTLTGRGDPEQLIGLQASAALLQDLKQRGMLDETLVVWSSEFGRTPWSQNTTGRDHNPKGYTVWLAGGGVKGGIVHGATDEVGYKAVEKPHYYSDLHATILRQLGLDYKKMEIPVVGRTMRLVEEGDGPIEEILS